MSRQARITLAICAMVMLAAFLVPLQSSSRHEPKLTVTYLLSKTNVWGQKIAFFAITNVGNAVAISYDTGSVEIFGRKKPVLVSTRNRVHRLLPGEDDIVEVFLYPLLPAPGERWRYTCLFAHDGIRSQIRDWQRAGGGSVMRGNWLIPQFLKGVVLDVNTTSEWIDNSNPPENFNPSSAPASRSPP